MNNEEKILALLEKHDEKFDKVFAVLEKQGEVLARLETEVGTLKTEVGTLKHDTAQIISTQEAHTVMLEAHDMKLNSLLRIVVRQGGQIYEIAPEVAKKALRPAANG